MRGRPRSRPASSAPVGGLLLHCAPIATNSFAWLAAASRATTARPRRRPWPSRGGRPSRGPSAGCRSGSARPPSGPWRGPIRSASAWGRRSCSRWAGSSRSSGGGSARTRSRAGAASSRRLGGVRVVPDIRDPDTDLGPVLVRLDAPTLFQEIAAVARRLGVKAARTRSALAYPAVLRRRRLAADPDLAARPAAPAGLDARRAAGGARPRRLARTWPGAMSSPSRPGRAVRPRPGPGDRPPGRPAPRPARHLGEALVAGSRTGSEAPIKPAARRPAPDRNASPRSPGATPRPRPWSRSRWSSPSSARSSTATTPTVEDLPQHLRLLPRPSGDASPTRSKRGDAPSTSSSTALPRPTPPPTRPLPRSPGRLPVLPLAARTPQRPLSRPRPSSATSKPSSNSSTTASSAASPSSRASSTAPEVDAGKLLMSTKD